MTQAVSPSQLGPLRRRLAFWMAGRIVAASILLGGVILVGSGPTGVDAFGPRFLRMVIAVTFATTIALAVTARSGVDHRRVAGALLVLDTLTITGVVYVTGGAHSVFTVLYGAIVLVGAMVLGGRAATTTAIAAGALYGFVSLGMALRIIPTPPGQGPPLSVVQPATVGPPLLSNWIGLGLVSMLASNLATRLVATGGDLQRARADAARYAELNERIVRSMSAGLLTTDANDAIVSANPSATEILQIAESALVGRAIADVLPHASRDESAPDPMVRGEGEVERADGRVIEFGFTRTALRDAGGPVEGWLIAFQDLTEIRRLQRNAREAERLASLGRLAAGLAHEIRNPLSSISGSVELVSESPALDPDDRRLLGLVTSEVDRLNDLVTTMLDVSRHREIAPQPTDMTALVDEVVQMAQAGLAEPAGVVLEWEPGEPETHDVDPSQFRQVLWNLVKNAVQASPVGTQVTVALPKSDALVLDVIDEGPGVPPEARASLFDAFYSTRTHGTGLGLTLVRQIVERHHGTLELVDSERGAHFRVRIPPASERGHEEVEAAPAAQ